jgi:hypothetical protein
MAPVYYCGMRHMPCVRPAGAAVPDPGPWSAWAVQPAAIEFFDHVFVRVPPPQPIFGAEIRRLELAAQQGSWLYYRRTRTPDRAASDRPGPDR